MIQRISTHPIVFSSYNNAPPNECRRVHVTTHRAPQSYEGTRPYVQTYGMYKYHGFAGCGAKTSYAKNPKIDALKLLPE